MSVRFVRILFSALALTTLLAGAPIVGARAQTAPASEAPAAPAQPVEQPAQRPAPPPAAAPAPAEPPRVRSSERIEQAKSRL
ncbi:MAG: hypothetical protein KDJ20_18245, partial [Hyphomicrobiales bacterium]|nr:hypothetical protein [Hyphomicrobiales bacterium]